jgi:hypothetical protein
MPYRPETSMILPALRWPTLSGQNAHGRTSAACTVSYIYMMSFICPKSPCSPCTDDDDLLFVLVETTNCLLSYTRLGTVD